MSPAASNPGTRRTRRLRRVRRWAFIVAILSLLSMVVTMGGREAGVRVGVAYLCVGDGCLQVGVGCTKPIDDTYSLVAGPFWARSSWNPDWALAWRPFRVFVDVDATFWQHSFIFPLWPLVLGSMSLWMYTAGALAGMRWARTTHCAVCGYDLAGVPVVEGATRCPECGAKRLN